MQKIIALFLVVAAAAGMNRMLSQKIEEDTGLPRPNPRRDQYRDFVESFNRDRSKQDDIELEPDDLAKIDSTKCFPKVLDIFGLSRNSENTFDPLKPDAQTAKLCPSLDATCCDADLLTEQFEHFRFTYLSLRDHMFFHHNITHFLREQKVQPVPLTVPATCASPDSSEAESEPTQDPDADTLLGQFLYQMEDAYAKYQSLNHTVSSHYSGFICGLCHPSATLALVDSSHFDSTKERRLGFRYNFASYQSIAKIYEQYEGFVLELSKAQWLLSRIPEVNGFRVAPPSSSLSQLACILDEVKKCAAIAKFSDLLSDSQRCVELAARFDLGLSVDVPETILEVYGLVSQFIQAKYQGAHLAAGSSDDLLGKLMFSRPKLDSEMAWSRFFPDIGEQGFDMAKHKYEQKEWFLGAFRGTVIAFLGLFGVHLLG